MRQLRVNPAVRRWSFAFLATVFLAAPLPAHASSVTLNFAGNVNPSSVGGLASNPFAQWRSRYG